MRDVVAAEALRTESTRPTPGSLLPRVVLVGFLVHALLAGVGSSRDPAFWAGTLTSMLLFFASLPFLMAGALAIASLTLLAILTPIAVAVRPFRPTGMRGLIADLVATNRPIVPGYFRIVASIRSPWFWGAVFGSLTATIQLTMQVARAAAV